MEVSQVFRPAFPSGVAINVSLAAERLTICVQVVKVLWTQGDENCIPGLAKGVISCELVWDQFLSKNEPEIQEPQQETKHSLESSQFLNKIITDCQQPSSLTKANINQTPAIPTQPSFFSILFNLVNDTSIFPLLRIQTFDNADPVFISLIIFIWWVLPSHLDA